MTMHQIPGIDPAFAHYLRLMGYRTCLSGKMPSSADQMLASKSG